MKKFLRRLALSVVALTVLMFAAVWLLGLKRHADAAPEAIAAAMSDAQVGVTHDDTLVFRPRQVPERMGVVLYPGAYVDVRGYAPTLRLIAAAGYRVVAVPMPMEVAIFGIDRVLAVQAAHPDIRRWVLIGHSLGGAMSGLFASRHPDALAGIIVWDSYPAGSLADFRYPVWHIHRATPDGAPPPMFAERRALFPANSRWVAIPGGIHMYFGAFSGGGYQEDWAPSISRAEQHRLVVEATLQALTAIERTVVQ